MSEVLGVFDLPSKSILEVTRIMREDFDRGLSADENEREKSSVKMLPTYVRKIPDGSESGNFLAVDLGGTKFRVLSTSIQDGKIEDKIENPPLDETIKDQ